MSPTTQEKNVTTDPAVMVMVKEEKSIVSAKATLCCGLSVNTWAKIAINLILPLTLGIFTVFIAFYQQEVTNKQRLEDRDIARIQRDQDLNISAMQREHDKVVARSQREEDELRRYQDLNISEMRRELDIFLANSKQNADNLNAEKQRNISQDQREHELQIEQQRYEKQMAIEHERHEQERARYQAQLALSYMNEIGDLIEKHQGSLSSHPISAALARAKTLNVIGQLGSNRSRPLIEFLHDAKQLTTKNNPLDLSGAQLNGLDFSGPSGLHIRRDLSLVGVHLNGAVFQDLEIYHWDFTSALLNGATFRNCNITKTIFDRASLIGADFSFSYLDMNTFSRADLSMSKFHAAIVRSSHFDDAILIEANFSNVISDATNLDRHLRFTYSNLVSTTFRNAQLSKVHFRLCNMTSTDLSQTALVQTLFFGSILAFASITNSKHPLRLSAFQYANFSHADLTGSTCVESKCEGDMVLSFHNARFDDVNIGRPRATIIEAGNASTYEDGDSIYCTQELLKNWEKQPVNGFIIRRERTIQNHCVYSMAKNETGTLSQKVLLSEPYKPSFISLIKERQAVAIFRAMLSDGVRIVIEERVNTQRILFNHTLSRDRAENNSPLVTLGPIILHPDAKELIFTIYFSRTGSVQWLNLIDIEINPLFSH